MLCEEPRVPGLPGAEDVTDGDVDYYGTDWENVDNGALEEEMQKCASTPCDAKTTNGIAPTPTPAQTVKPKTPAVTVTAGKKQEIGRAHV